ncbi:MAG: glycogen synthase GlgA [Thermodesulfobacteriota bacterium]
MTISKSKNSKNKLNILFVATEMEPFAKIGGLGEVISTLTKRLSGLDCDVRVVLPYYKQVKKYIRDQKIKVKKLDKTVQVCIDWLVAEAQIYEVKYKDVIIYLLENDEFFGRDQIYATPKGEFEDNDIRFGFLSLGALEVAKVLKFKTDIIHCHDWQTALLPISLKWRKHIKDDEFFKDSKIVFTIHNISYQGQFDKGILDKFGIPAYLFTAQGLELYGKANLLKGGILYSDLVTTVSPTFAEEIKKREFGHGMDAVLKWVSRKSNNLVGILNGIDYDLWNPETDKAIYNTYNQKSIEAKKQNSLKLKKELNLVENDEFPLVTYVSKLTEQKGLDLLLDSLPQIFDLGYQVAIIGIGDARFEQMVRRANRKFRKKLSIAIKPTEELERKIYAGSDMIVMPSRFEPCGLGQIIGLRYGTIPVVRGTGGLLDTVIDYNEDNKNGNGFVFHEFSKIALLDAMLRAISVYDDKKAWNKLVVKAMKSDFSWRKSGKTYKEIYQKLLTK